MLAAESCTPLLFVAGISVSISLFTTHVSSLNHGNTWAAQLASTALSCMKTIRTAPYAAVAAKVSNGVATVRMLNRMVNATMKTVMIVSRFWRSDLVFSMYCKIHKGPTNMARPRMIVAQVTLLFMTDSLVYLVVLEAKFSGSL